jgi:DNA-binding MarR family transcriptional regulator
LLFFEILKILDSNILAAKLFSSFIVITIMPNTRTQLVEQFQEGIRAISRQLWSGADQCFTRLKLYPGQARVLHLIYHKVRTNVKDLAAALGTTPSAATQLVETLVQSGLVKRKIDNKDRRVVRLEISRKGSATFNAFHREHLRLLTRLLKPLSNQELSQLISIQQKLT